MLLSEKIEKKSMLCIDPHEKEEEFQLEFLIRFSAPMLGVFVA